MPSPARRASRAQVSAFAAVGVGAGLLLGYIFIGSIDKMLRLRAGDHYNYPRRALQLPGKGGGDLATSSAADDSQGLVGHDHNDNLQSMRGGNYPQFGDTIHTLCTSNGSPYLNYQTRIMYGTYKLVQQMPGGDKLVGFTRILHRTQPDILMDEVPTFRANPLTPQCDGWCEFPVSDRPNAVAQFFKAAQDDPSMIKAPWLLMLEGDYVWMKPLQAPLAESKEPSWAFPYSYITPAVSGGELIMRKMFPEDKGPLESIPNSGPAPVLMRVEDWLKVTPDWERLAAHIEADKETKERLGWVREMYAFSTAAALQGVKLDLRKPPDSPLMAQPPADHAQGNACLLHYTWGILVEDAGGSKVWTFDKRDYTAAEIERKSPRIPLPPPHNPEWKLHDGVPYDAALHNLTVAMLTQMNRAIERLPVLS